MCTAMTVMQRDAYFGRTLDLEHHYEEKIAVTPVGYSFYGRSVGAFSTRFSIIGVATVKNGYPLYYDAVSSRGLCMAGLNFVGNARFSAARDDCYNLAQYELIPFILGRAKSLDEARDMLLKTRLLDTPFDERTPPSELHYFLSDGKRSLAAEPAEDGFEIYEDPYNVLTNNPPFPYHDANVKNYMVLGAKEAENRFSDKLPLAPYSRGLGAFGLPGDLSSSSRFVRASFAASNALPKNSEDEEVGQVFHMLDFVSQPEGLVAVGDGFERTQYSVCANLRTGTYYYRTYTNSRITRVRMTEGCAGAASITVYPFRYAEDIFVEN